MSEYYHLNITILNLSLEIARLTGMIDVTNSRKPKTELRKANKISSIQSSLSIEGNTLSLEQVSTVLEGKPVIGPSKDILEVKNAIQVYEKLHSFSYLDESSYLSAHKLLMAGLLSSAGVYRTKGVAIVKGEEMAHLAPPAWNVPHLMAKLFQYLKEGEENLILKSCVFHYEMEFIHPFLDGNGRMGRLWQTVILMQENPVFEFLALEKYIKQTQKEYYQALSASDKVGNATPFIEYILQQIVLGLEDLISSNRTALSDSERLNYFIEFSKKQEFTRKDYMDMFRNISSATATRDLRYGVESGILQKMGDNRTSRYRVKE